MTAAAACSDLYSDEVTIDQLLVPIEGFQKLQLAEAATRFRLPAGHRTTHDL